MSPSVIAIAASVFLLSVLLVGAVRRYALRTNLLDQPNARSSHSNPTPRGGGIAIALVSVIAVMWCWWQDMIGTGLLTALAGGGGMIAVVGFLDDRRGVSPVARFLVHAAAAWLGVTALQIFSGVGMGSVLFDSGWIGYVAAIVSLVWLTNLFNFMDGIDGIAAAEATFVSWAAAGLMIATHASGDSTLAAIVVGCTCVGFLVWNWPPARIFMGDVGSGYLGFTLGVIGLNGAQSASLPVLTWLILGGVFFVDATLTLVRRLLRGERLYVAHRTHAYQSLARRWNSHARVTVLVFALNVLWLLPIAYFSAASPTRAPLLTVVALLPVVCLCLLSGSGRAEGNS